MNDRFTCSGGCGKTFKSHPPEGQRVLSVICEECWLRLHGPPAQGFTGFDSQGAHWTVTMNRAQRRALKHGDGINSQFGHGARQGG